MPRVHAELGGVNFLSISDTSLWFGSLTRRNVRPLCPQARLYGCGDVHYRQVAMEGKERCMRRIAVIDRALSDENDAVRTMSNEALQVSAFNSSMRANGGPARC